MFDDVWRKSHEKQGRSFFIEVLRKALKSMMDKCRPIVRTISREQAQHIELKFCMDIPSS